jgi:hypothetical protein
MEQQFDKCSGQCKRLSGSLVFFLIMPQQGLGKPCCFGTEVFDLPEAIPIPGLVVTIRIDVPWNLREPAVVK